MLREASVFGQSFYEEPLKLTTTVSEGLYEALAHLCEVGLLDELPDIRRRGYQFRHSLVQQVLYEGLLRRQRAELHLRAAESLELAEEEGMEVEPEQLAYHFQEAGHSERAAAYHLAARRACRPPEGTLGGEESPARRQPAAQHGLAGGTVRHPRAAYSTRPASEEPRCRRCWR